MKNNKLRQMIANMDADPEIQAIERAISDLKQIPSDIKPLIAKLQSAKKNKIANKVEQKRKELVQFQNMLFKENQFILGISKLARDLAEMHFEM